MLIVINNSNNIWILIPTFNYGFNWIPNETYISCLQSLLPKYIALRVGTIHFYLLLSSLLFYRSTGRVCTVIRSNNHYQSLNQHF